MRTAALLFLLAGLGGAPESEPTWPTYHGAYSLDGVADASVPDVPERIWRYKAGNRVETTPVSADGRLYFTTAKGGLVALDPAGAELWKIALHPEGKEMYTTPPLCAEGLLVVGASTGFLIAYDSANGKEKWKYDLGGSLQGTPNRVDLDGGKKGVVAISQSDGALHAVELESGKAAWKTAPIDRCDGSAGSGNGLVVMGSCASALHVFTVAKAAKTADISLGGDNQVAGGVAIVKGIAYASTRSGKFCAVDIAGNKIAWTNAENQSESFSTPAVNDRFAIFAAGDGKVYALKRDSGEKVWAVDTGDKPSSPVIAGSRVVVSSGGNLLVYDLATGAKLSSAAVGDEITSPAVFGGRIYVGSDDGSVSAYGKK